jgi:hypothetical protein
VKLATLYPSFVLNSAPIERLFSKMGDIMTKTCNRMGTEKLRDLTFIKTRLRRTHGQEETARHRLKRQFGNTVMEFDADGTKSRIEDEEIVREAEECTILSDSDSGSDNNSEDSADGEPRSNSFSPVAREMQAANEDRDVGELSLCHLNPPSE